MSNCLGFDQAEKKCDQCGKTFFAWDMDRWAYKRISPRKVYFCSYKCVTRWDEENFGKKKNNCPKPKPRERMERCVDLLKVGVNLQRLREAQGLTRKEVAAKLGVHSATVAKWENGNHVCDMENAAGMARLYKTTIDSIMTGEKTESSMMLYDRERYLWKCVECGNIVNSRMRFCSHCGRKFNKERIIPDDES